MERTFYARACLAASLLALSLLSAADARIITVDDDAPADFNNIQDAIDDATDWDVVEVKPGTYTGPGNREIRFNGKPITVRGTNPDDFDVVAATVIDCNNQGHGFIFDRGEDPNSVLSGLKITRGVGGWGSADAGAIACDGGSPIIADCIITDNRGRGGGISATRSYLIVRNCIITHNTSDYMGGGIFGTEQYGLTVEDCIISHNIADDRGGGIRTTSANVPFVVKNCIITGNRSRTVGGGLSSRGGYMIIRGSIIAGNVAAERGGGIGARQYARPAISNSIIYGNSAPAGPQIAVDDPHEDSVFGPPVLSALYSNIAGGQADVYNDGSFSINWGPGNIDADPCFANPGYWRHISDPNIHIEPNDPNAIWIDGDYHLKSQAGRWDAANQSWMLDDATSLCIDAGDPDFPVGPEPFPNGGRINLGAYGATAEASKSYFGKPPCETIVAGDINGDCIIDARDFSFIGAHWLADGMIQSSGKATDPNPPDGAAGIRTDPILSWTPGSGALIHIIFLGTTPDLSIYSSYWGAQTEPTLNPSLSEGTTYYWRVDEFGPQGIAAGPVWTFTTKSGTTR